MSSRAVGACRGGWACALVATLAIVLSLSGGCGAKTKSSSKPPRATPRPKHYDEDILPPDARVLELSAKRPATRPAPPTPEPAIIAQGERATLIYTLRQARSEVLATAIEGLISPEGSIQASPALNVLIVNDRAELMPGIAKVVRELDRPVAQLLVEARIVEVAIDQDLEWEIRHLFSGGSEDRTVQGADINLTTPGANPSPTEGSLLTIRSFAAGDYALDTFVRLLVTKGRAKILSSPNLVVGAGSEGSIITGQEVPIQSATIISGSLNTTTQFKRVGIKLRVNLLQITNDTARLELNPEVSTVTGFTTAGAQGITNPIVAIRNVTSTLSLKDGEILTVGGLLSTEDRDTTKGIPILQDIPGVGMLFQSRRREAQRTQLIFFLRVHILPEGVPDTIRVHKPDDGLKVLDQVANPTTMPTSVPTAIEAPPSVPRRLREAEERAEEAQP